MILCVMMQQTFPGKLFRASIHYKSNSEMRLEGIGCLTEALSVELPLIHRSERGIVLE